jgi:hypothetical protein
MRVIPVNVHNIIDYIYGVLIIAAPWLFNFARGGAETYVPVAAGLLILLMSLITNYKYSLAKVIAYNMHLRLDIVIGLFLIASPWIFGFYDYVYIPHLVFGIIAVVTSLMSKKHVSYREY